MLPVPTYVLNSMDWNNGIGALPGITLTGLEFGSVIDQYLILVAGLGLDAALAARLQASVSLVPAPRIFTLAALVTPGEDRMSRRSRRLEVPASP